jgi:hypothetical protein
MNYKGRFGAGCIETIIRVAGNSTYLLRPDKPYHTLWNIQAILEEYCLRGTGIIDKGIRQITDAFCGKS